MEGKKFIAGLPSRKVMERSNKEKERLVQWKAMGKGGSEDEMRGRYFKVIRGEREDDELPQGSQF